MKKNKKYKNQNAVSSLLGTLMVLSISISLFAIVNITFIPNLSDDCSKPLNIAVTVEDNNLLIQNYGGESLPIDTNIRYTIDGETKNINIREKADTTDPDTWLIGWNYRKEIIIDHRMIPTDFENFPFLIKINDLDLEDKARNDGYDIVFTKEDEITKIPHEIEYYNQGYLVTWVNISHLSNTVDTTLYIYYGNPSASNQENPDDVWNSNYKGVWHLSEDGTNTRSDSTTNNNHGTPVNYDGTENVEGIMGYADYFPGYVDWHTSKYLDCGNDHSVDMSTHDWTVSAWVNYIPSEYESITHPGVATKGGGVGDLGYMLVIYRENFTKNDEKIFYWISNDTSRIHPATNYNTGINDSSWHYLLAHIDRDSHVDFYLDGIKIKTTSYKIDIYDGLDVSNSGNNLEIGRWLSPGHSYKGTIDEVRISNIVRSEDWIETCYHNQKNPEVFITISEEDPNKYIYLNDINHNDVWDIGEIVSYPLKDEDRFKPIEVFGSCTTDECSSTVLTGKAQEPRIADVQVYISIDPDYLTPEINDVIKLNITVVNYGPSTSGEIIIKNRVPDGLVYEGIAETIPADTGVFTYNNGFFTWVIQNLSSDEGINTAVLSISLKVSPIVAERDFTQLAVLLDGSGSISAENWNLQITGLADAVDNSSCFPHDGTVELTVIQFAQTYASLEVGPVIVNESNYLSTSDQIRNIVQRCHGTSMACAINLAADILSGDKNGYLVGTSWEGCESINFSVDNKHVILILTDGNGNYVCPDGCYSNVGGYDQSLGEQSAAAQSEYLRDILGMIQDQDEIDICAIQGSQGINIDFLVNNIAWPGRILWPSYDPIPSNSGWVHEIDSYQQLHDSIDEIFNYIFNRLITNVEISDSSYLDENQVNNEFTIVISPHD